VKLTPAEKSAPLPYPRWLVITLCCAGLLAVFVPVFLKGMDKARAGADDFLGLYAGARLAGTPGIYDPSLIRQVQLETAGVTGDALLSTRLPCFPLMLRPLAQLPYATAHAIWYLLRFIAVIGFLFLWPYSSRWLAALVCCWSLPLAAGLANGQDAPLLLLWIALSQVLEQAKRPFWAGLALSMCAAKYHLFLLVPFVLLYHRRWRVLAGGLAGGIVLASLCCVAGGWDWPAQYLKAISVASINPGPQIMPNLHGLLSPAPLWIVVLLSVVVGGISVVFITRLDFPSGFAIALFGSLLISYHAYTADAVTLVPAVLMVLAYSRAAALRYAGVLISTPLPWLLILRRR